MAIVDKYRNKLMANKKNDSLQSGLQNNTTSLQSGLQDNVTATNELGETNKSYSKGGSSSNYAWPDIQSMINVKTANPKAELQMAMQKAQSMSNEYLKALGLQGSGMGQSQLSDIGVQYQNALSNINNTARDEVISQVDKDFENAVSSGRYSARDVQNYINQYGEQTGLGESWKNVAEDYGATYEQEADRVAENLQKIIKGEAVKTLNGDEVLATEKQKNYAKILNEKLTQARLNGDQNLYYEILDENSDFLNTLKLPDDNTTQETINSSSDNYSYSKIKQTIEGLKYLEAIEFPSGYSVKNTGKNKYAIFKDGKNIYLGHDYTIDEVLNEINVA